jgi:methionyl aminopeptidase
MGIIIKTEEQIDGIRKSCQLAADTLTHVEAMIKPGVTTEAINREAEAYIRAHGGVPAPLGYLGFPKATCISLNEVICHGIPSEETVLKEGDIVNVDVTTIVNGYYGDTSRMYPVGAVSDEAERLIAVARDCLHAGIVQVRPGAEFWQISKAIQDYADKRGFSVVHQFGGHGTGLQFHEEPVINHNYDEASADHRPMLAGMVFTIEPMINAGVPEAVIDKRDKWTARTKDGRLSAQWEHTVLVSDFGVEVLTH